MYFGVFSYFLDFNRKTSVVGENEVKDLTINNLKVELIEKDKLVQLSDEKRLQWNLKVKTSNLN